MSLFAVAAYLVASLSQAPLEDRTYSIPPSVNLSAIHLIHCFMKDGGDYTGSGWLIAKNTMATANHIASEGTCRDETAGVNLYPYKLDPRHDFALMTGKEPEGDPYIKYTCARPKPNHYYTSYGITSYGYDWGHNIFRDNVVQATNQIIKNDDQVADLGSSKGMRFYYGAVAPGMSGGPVIDPLIGYAYALNNAGDNESTLLFDLADTILCSNK